MGGKDAIVPALSGLLGVVITALVSVVIAYWQRHKPELDHTLNDEDQIYYLRSKLERVERQLDQCRRHVEELRRRLMVYEILEEDY
jgi:hypothetical protein